MSSEGEDDELKRFKQWVEIEKRQEQLSKDRIEYIKAATDFTKLLVTNLHLLNAGGLLATPTIAKFLEFEKLPAADRVFAAAFPATLFTLGLILAALCAYKSYHNFWALADKTELVRIQKLWSDAAIFPPYKVDDSLKAKRTAALADIEEKMPAAVKRINSSYFWAHLFGWCSGACFLIACASFGYHMK